MNYIATTYFRYLLLFRIQLRRFLKSARSWVYVSIPRFYEKNINWIIVSILCGCALPDVFVKLCVNVL